MSKKIALQSDSESESVELEAPEKSVLASFRHYLVPLAITLLAEAWFCHTMYQYCLDAPAEAANLPGNVQDHLSLGKWYQGVFVGCIVMRIVVTLLWKVSAFGCPDAHFAALFMLFSTAQWIYYLLAYYLVREELTGIAYADTLLSSSASADDASQSLLASCIDKHGTTGCGHLIRSVFECAKEFNAQDCTGFAWVGRNSTKCCVETKYSLTHPHTILDFYVWMPSMDAYFSIIKWVAVLAMKWVLEQNPLMRRAYSPFVQGSMVDILDSLLFAAYLMSDKVLLPKYGITDGGAAAPADATLYNWLAMTTIVAMTLSVLSPCLYIFCRSGDATTESSSRSFADAINDIMRSLRMLRSKDSHKFVDEAIQLQLDSYKDAAGAGEFHAVRVGPEDAESAEEKGWLAPLNAEDDSRHAMAKHAGRGMYSVKYDDATTEKVDVRRLRPDIHKQAYNPCAAGCCSGWFSGLPTGHDSFEHRAEILDAVRSLLFLELPFFMWRYFFEFATLDITSFTVIVMMKNLVWGLHDFLVIVSCNNPAMTIFGYTPLATLSTMINGSAMASVFVGPAGFVRIAADITTTSVKSQLAEQKSGLQVQKAWLLVERERVVHSGKPRDRDEGVQRFDDAIAQTEAAISSVEQQLAMVHS